MDDLISSEVHYLSDGPVDTLGHALLEQGLRDVAHGVEDGAHEVIVVARLQHHLHVSLWTVGELSNIFLK